MAFIGIILYMLGFAALQQYLTLIYMRMKIKIYGKICACGELCHHAFNMVAEQWHVLHKGQERRLRDEPREATENNLRGQEKPLQEEEHQECSSE